METMFPNWMKIHQEKVWNTIRTINDKLSTANVYLIKPNKEKGRERIEIVYLPEDESEYNQK